VSGADIEDPEVKKLAETSLKLKKKKLEEMKNN